MDVHHIVFSLAHKAADMSKDKKLLYSFGKERLSPMTDKKNVSTIRCPFGHVTPVLKGLYVGNINGALGRTIDNQALD